MLYKTYQKALTQITLKVLIGLENNLLIKENSSIGYIYIIYKDSDQTLRIGFSSSLINLKNLLLRAPSLLLANRNGCAREERLLKATLKELGHTPEYGNDLYKYSTKFIYMAGIFMIFQKIPT